jgi:hypothetical protein
MLAFGVVYATGVHMPRTPVSASSMPPHNRRTVGASDEADNGKRHEDRAHDESSLRPH